MFDPAGTCCHNQIYTIGFGGPRANIPGAGGSYGSNSAGTKLEVNSKRASIDPATGKIIRQTAEPQGALVYAALWYRTAFSTSPR
jgi:hypothetical protein